MGEYMFYLFRIISRPLWALHQASNSMLGTGIQEQTRQMRILTFTLRETLSPRRGVKLWNIPIGKDHREGESQWVQAFWKKKYSAEVWKMSRSWAGRSLRMCQSEKLHVQRAWSKTNHGRVRRTNCSHRYNAKGTSVWMRKWLGSGWNKQSDNMR